MSIELIAGNLGLDLANNRHRMRELDPERPYMGLLEIATRSGTLSTEEAARLARAAQRRSAEALTVAARADALAAAIQRVLEAAIDGEATPRTALATINREVALAESSVRIVPRAGAFERW